MTVLPIVARELRVASRRRGTYWSRSAMAGAAIIAGIVVYLMQQTLPHLLGPVLFQVLCWLAYVCFLFAGVRSTADCLSEEKRDGTLGLLFLTDLKGYDVVGGKLVATSLNSFFGLLAILPVLVVPLLMGGITQGECGRAALALMDTVFFSLSIGMFMSAVCVSPRKAVTATFIVILTFALGVPIFVEAADFVQRSHDLMIALKLTCPSSAMTAIADADYRKSPENFWLSVGAIQGMSWLCLGLASWIVPRSWQDKAQGAKRQRWREMWRRFNFGSGDGRHAFRRRLLDINAFFWLASREQRKPVWIWAALSSLAGLWTWGMIANGRSWLEDSYVPTLLVPAIMLKFWVASEAGRRLGEDRQIGALELLLSTPMSVAEIVRGQWRALQRQFLGPLLTVLAAQVILLTVTLRYGHEDVDEFAAMLSFSAAYLIMLVMDLAALGCVSMWAGLTSKKPGRILGGTILRVLVLPWMILGVIWLFGFFLEVALRGEPNLTWRSFLALYCIVGLVVDGWFGVRAWRNLHTEFREVATRRFEARRSFWSRLMGRK